MKTCLLLLRYTDHLQVWHMIGGKISSTHAFSDTEEDRAEFADFLSSYHCPTYFLVDLIEEDFRLETIPHLTGKNRRAFLQRKFEQFYRATPLRSATMVQRQKTGRRDAEMLFSALTHPELITPWLDLLAQHRIPLAGIYSIPQLSAPLIQDYPSSHLLLITWDKSSGLRETYFHSHHLQLSRLTPARHDVSFPDMIAAELPRTYHYLNSLGLLPAGQVLDVRIVGHRDDLTILKYTLPANPNLRYDFVELTTLAQRLGIDGAYPDSDTRSLFLQLLVKHTPKNQYGNADHTHYFDLWRLRRWLNLTSAALVIISLIVCLQMLYWNDVPDSASVDAVKRQTSFTQNNALTILRKLPKTEVPAADIQTAVTTLRTLQQRSILPNQFLLPLSQVMGRFPDIHLDELSWQIATVEPNFSAHPIQLITLQGHLENISGNASIAADYFEQFQHALEQQGYRLSLPKPAFDLSTQSEFSDQPDSENTTHSFTLKLFERVPI